jgi:hypothetical protein
MKRIYAVGRVTPLEISSDGGLTWNTSPGYSFATFVRFSAPYTNPYKLIIAKSTGVGSFNIEYSNDSGTSFNPSGGNWSTGGETLNTSITAYGFDTFAVDSTTVYVLGRYNLYKSINGGASFDIQFPSVESLLGLNNPLSNLTRCIFFSTPSIGIIKLGNYLYKTINGGASFTQLNGGIPLEIEGSGLNSRGIYIDSTGNRIVIAGITRLYTSVDGGDTFSSYTLNDGQLNYLWVNRTENTSYIRNGSDIYKVEDDGINTLNPQLINTAAVSGQGGNQPLAFANNIDGFVSRFFTFQNGVSTDGGFTFIVSTNNLPFDNDIDYVNLECGCPEGSELNLTSMTCISQEGDFTVNYPVIACPGYRFIACPDAPAGTALDLISVDVEYDPFVGQIITFNTDDPKLQWCYTVYAVSVLDINLPEINSITTPVLQSFVDCISCTPGIFKLENCNTEEVIYSDTLILENYIGGTVVLNINDLDSCWNITKVLVSEAMEPIIDVTDLINSGVFEDCECCLDSLIPIVKEKLKIRFYDLPYFKVSKENISQCDIDANQKFANMYYKKFLAESEGVGTCCKGISLEKLLLQKELSDLSLILHPEFCIIIPIDSEEE